MKRKQVMAFLLAVAMVAGNVAIVPESVDAATTTEYLTEVTAPHVHGDDCYAEGAVKLGTADLTGKVGNDYQPLTEEGYYTSQTVTVYTKAAITNPSDAEYNPSSEKWEITETTKDVTTDVNAEIASKKVKYYTVEDIQAVEGAESEKKAGFYSVQTYTKLTEGTAIHVDGENVHLYVSSASQAAIEGDKKYLGSDDLEGKTDADGNNLTEAGWYTKDNESEEKYTAAEDPTCDYATFNATTKNWYLNDTVTIGEVGDLYIKPSTTDDTIGIDTAEVYYKATALKEFTPSQVDDVTPTYDSETQKWTIEGTFKTEVDNVEVESGAEYLSDVSGLKDENGEELPEAGFYVKNDNFTLYTEATPNDPSADTTNYKMLGDQILNSEQIDQIITKDGKQYLDLSNIIVTGAVKANRAEVQDVSSDPSAFNSNVILTLGNGDGYEVKVTTDYSQSETYDGTAELTNSDITDLHSSLSTFKLWTDSDKDNLIDAGELKGVTFENLSAMLPTFKVFNKQVYKDVDNKLTVSGFDLKTGTADGYTQIADTEWYIKNDDLAKCMEVYGIYDGYVEGPEGDYSKLLTSGQYSLTATTASVGEKGQGTVTVTLSIAKDAIGNAEAIEKTYEVAAYTNRELKGITAEICYADNSKKYIFKDETLTNDAFCVKADFGDLGTVTLGTSEYEISGAATSTIGTKEITVTAKADSNVKTTVNCTVVDVKPESLQATYPKTSLVEGSVIDLNDIQATVVLYDGTNDVDRVSVKPSEFRSGLEPAGLGKLKIAKGENKITVMWADQSCELKITGTAKPVTPSYPDPTPSTPDPAPSTPAPTTPSTDKPADTKPTDKPADTTPAESNTITTDKDGAQIIVGTDGAPVENKVVIIGNDKYITNDEGVIVKNDFASTAKGNKVFTDADGKIVTDKTIVVDGKKYVAKESGALAVSEVVTTAKGNKVYCDATGAVVTDKTIKVDGKKYVAKENGVLAVSEMVTTAKGNKVYCGKTGAIVTGKSFKVDGKRYVASKTGAIVTSKWVKVGDKAYYCDKNGVVTKVKPAKKK